MKQHRFFWYAAASIAVLALVLTGAYFWASSRVPDRFTVVHGTQLDLSSLGMSAEKIAGNDTSASVSQTQNRYLAQVRFLNILPIKTVEVTEVEGETVVPCGTPFGVKLFTDGVVVVGMTPISTDTGDVNPAEAGGLMMGDVIQQINGKVVTRKNQIGDALSQSGGAPVTMTIDRNGETKLLTITPARSAYDGQYKGGIWVRDSTAGIGIVTFYRSETGAFGGLGHGICDVDTNGLMPLGSGEIVPVAISGVTKGQRGTAGELKGYFSSDHSIGRLFCNMDGGVYGTLDRSPVLNESVPVARKQEVKQGAVEILTTIDSGAPQRYDAVIESIDLREEVKTKNLVVRITDQRLLQKTGGIVQGMSGSPILQDGKLVGAVTHVFLNDPTRGYGIFAERMIEVSDSVTQRESKPAA